jgi:hypothetical protein
LRGSALLSANLSCINTRLPRASTTSRSIRRHTSLGYTLRSRSTFTNRSTKTITIKVPTVNQETAQPSVASQVRELIRVNKKTTDEQGMIEIVIHKLGLSKDRGRSVVKAFWNKVEV